MLIFAPNTLKGLPFILQMWLWLEGFEEKNTDLLWSTPPFWHKSYISRISSLHKLIENSSTLSHFVRHFHPRSKLRFLLYHLFSFLHLSLLLSNVQSVWFVSINPFEGLWFRHMWMNWFFHHNIQLMRLSWTVLSHIGLNVTFSHKLLKNWCIYRYLTCIDKPRWDLRPIYITGLNKRLF